MEKASHKRGTELIERERVEQVQNESERYARSLLRLSRKLEQAQTYSEALNAALEEVKAILGYQNVWTYLLSEDKEHLHLLTITGEKSQMVSNDFPTLTVKGDPFLEEIFAGSDIVLVEDARIDPRTNKDIVAQLGNRTIVNVPIILMEKHLGAFGTGSFGDEGVRVPTPSQLEYLRALASHMAVTLDRIRLLLESKQAEESLRTSEERYRILIEQASDGIFIADPQGHYTDVNSSGCAMLGYSREELFKLTLRDVIDPDDLAAHPLRLSELQEGKNLLVERKLRRKDGTTFFVELSAKMLPNGYYQAMIRDISQRKQAEEVLKESEERFRLIVNTTLDVVIVMDANGLITEWNAQAEAVFGWSRNEVKGRSLAATIIPADMRDAHRSGLKRFLESGEGPLLNQRIEVMALRRNGEVFPAELSITPLKTAESYIFSAFLRDVTERKRAEERQHFLASASRTLASSLDYETTLATVAQLAVPKIADWCTVYLTTPEGGIEQVALAHANPEKVKWAHELQKRYPPDPNAPRGVAQVIRSGQSEFMPEIPAELLEPLKKDPEMSRLLDELQLTGSMSVPLTLREKTLGAVSLVSAESRLRYTPQDLELAEELARRIAIAVENARLYRSAQELNQALEQRVIERTVQLQESEEKFSKAFLSSPAAVSIASMPDGRYINVNEALAKLTGYSKEELIGHTSAELNLVDNPTARTKILEATQKYGFARNVEIQIRTKSNQIVDVLTSIEQIELSGQPCMLSVNYDITERKRAEGKFRGLLESAPDAIVVVDKEGHIQLINSQTEKMFGYQRDELLGQPVEAIVPKRFRKKHVKNREDYFIEHPTRPMGIGLDLFGLRKNGNEFPIEISLSPLETEDGILVSAAIRDITERKRAEADIQKLNQDLKQRAAQLEAANKELESFSYSVSHDLRAPLRSIDGFSQILLEDYGNQIPVEGVNYLERVRAAAQRMAVLIDDLLNLARVTRAALNPRLINLSEMAEGISKTLKEESPDRNVFLSIMPGLMVEGDPHLMHIVLENLLSNAWKFTSKKEQAVIEFGQQNHKTKERTFYIRDNGTGFDMAYVNKLFGVFQRLHSVSEFPGTGVGLATVHRIIAIHGGRIWAEGEEGKGATFYFTL